MATKWRLTAWCDDRPDVKLVKYWRGQCRFCAVLRVLAMTETMEKARKLPKGTAKWTTEYLDGGLQGWHVKHRSGLNVETMARIHGH